MKICVIVPSRPHLVTAGVRIRYERIRAPLASLGWTLEVVPIDEVRDLSTPDGRVFLLSKCQDARGLALATAARQACIAMGVDLFDDYFSQHDDPRFAAQRLWLAAIAQQASFFICSTPRMLDVGEKYFPSGSGHLLADAHEEFDAAQLERELAAKIHKAKRERRIPLLWFGISGNPNFPVGLHDLSAFSEALRPFQERSYQPSLTILTDRKGVDGEALNRLRRIPIPFVIREWSAEREKQALSRALVSFLPVNFQQFSIAKSLNRGVSALVGGTQVLTAGYPLYGELGDYVYDDAATLIDDLENSRLKLSDETVPDFARWVASLAAPAAEASALIDFLDGQAKAARAASVEGRQIAVLQGRKSAAAIDRFARAQGWLSLASPLVPGGVDYDAHLGFFGEDPSLRLRVSPAALERLPEEMRVAAVWADETLGKGAGWDVPLESLPFDLLTEEIAASIALGACRSAAIDMEVMKITRDFFEKIFENVCIVETELDPVRNSLRALERN